MAQDHVGRTAVASTSMRNSGCAKACTPIQVDAGGFSVPNVTTRTARSWRPPSPIGSSEYGTSVSRYRQAFRPLPQPHWIARSRPAAPARRCGRSIRVARPRPVKAAQANSPVRGEQPVHPITVDQTGVDVFFMVRPRYASSTRGLAATSARAPDMVIAPVSRT
jgi:hypothetical protein